MHMHTHTHIHVHTHIQVQLLLINPLLIGLELLGGSRGGPGGAAGTLRRIGYQVLAAAPPAPPAPLHLLHLLHLLHRCTAAPLVGPFAFTPRASASAPPSRCARSLSS